MIIQNYTLFMESKRTYREESTLKESITFWRDDPYAGESKNPSPDIVELSSEAQKMLASKPDAPEEREETLLPLEDQLKIRILQTLIEKLTGRKIRILIPKISRDPEKMEPLLAKLQNLAPKAENEREGWGLVYDHAASYSEEEAVSFKAGGIVRTEDGREISFQLNLNIHRSFKMQQEIHLRAGDALKDPLIINFGRSSAGLAPGKFSFDLDADGKEDQVSYLLEGSGFLALDANEDNIINDGSELFGPATGNGFRELARHDADGNGWIDENDPVFHKLRIWLKTETGENRLLLLGEAGIGAIYTGHLNTLFHLKDENLRTQGILRSTGVFLKENGEAGTIQQIDLKI